MDMTDDPNNPVVITDELLKLHAEPLENSAALRSVGRALAQSIAKEIDRKALALFDEK
jgi:hypothetical protein